MRFTFLKTLSLVIATATLLSLPLAFSSMSVTKDFEAGGIKKIEIKNPKGEVNVMGVKGGSMKISVSLEKIQFDPKCKFTMEENAGVLRLTVSHESGLFDKANCVGKLTVSTPADLKSLDVTTGSGQLKVSGVDTALEFKTATGNVEMRSLNLKSVTGKTATGSIALYFQSCPKRADIDFITATGDAEVYLGSGCKIRAAHKSATGDLFNEMGDNEEYQVLVSMKSASGNLKIKKLAK